MTQVQLIALDADFARASWSLDAESFLSARATLGRAANEAKLVLRIYQTPASGPTRKRPEVVDHELTRWSDQRVVMLGPPKSSSHGVLGLLCEDGRFAAIARSETVERSGLAMRVGTTDLVPLRPVVDDQSGDDGATEFASRNELDAPSQDEPQAQVDRPQAPPAEHAELPPKELPPRELPVDAGWRPPRLTLP
ncbi:MAG: DUF4912 domain-containing protein [Myxococcales bacterium]|nr:DUF4912 domain-containing protein [Myxococcales bacterium]